MSETGEQPPIPPSTGSAPPPPAGYGQYMPPPTTPPYAPPTYQAPPTYPPNAYYAPQVPGYGYPRDHPHAGLALGLGLGGIIGGFFTCGIAFAIGPFAWYFGQRARNEIRRSNGMYHAEGNATAGMVLGIVSTVFLVLCLIGLVLLIGFANDLDTGDGTSALALLGLATGRS